MALRDRCRSPNFGSAFKALRKSRNDRQEPATTIDPQQTLSQRQDFALGLPVLSLVAIISLRRGNFLFDLDRSDIE
jgi:hypothetical protein